MTGHERHRLPDEPDPGEVAEEFGIEAGKERAGPVEDDEPEDQPIGRPLPASEIGGSSDGSSGGHPAGGEGREREDGAGNEA